MWRALVAGDGAPNSGTTIGVDGSGQLQVLVAVRTNDDPVGFTTACETNPSCQETPHPTNLLLVTSPDGGAHWTAPLRVNSASGSFFFPWVAAGSSGVVDADYYRTASLRPNDPTDQWFIGFSQITGATAVVSGAVARYTSTPHMVSTQLDPKTVHVGGICTFGVFCAAVPNANRRLADSISIALDPAGGANAVWTNDASGTRRVDFACQNSGPSAFTNLKPLHGCYGSK